MLHDFFVIFLNICKTKVLIFLIFYIINFYNRSTIWRISSHKCVQHTRLEVARVLWMKILIFAVPVCKIGRTRSIPPVVQWNITAAPRQESLEDFNFY